MTGTTLLMNQRDGEARRMEMASGTMQRPEITKADA
jgi:hypothetical protein